jgi:F0F1-type ATP synthase gamma subunit
MSIDRLADIQERLARLYKLLKGLERAKDEAEAAEKPRVQLKIDAQWDEITPLEREYAQRLAQQVKRQDVPEPIAEVVVAELVDEIELIQTTVKDDSTQKLLMQILTELQKPGTPASAKLKVAIPIIPNVVSYEFEGDTETVVRRLFPTFVKAYEGIKSIRAQEQSGK